MKKIVRESLAKLKEDVETAPLVKPATPKTTPNRPSPIKREEPSVKPKPKAKGDKKFKMRDSVKRSKKSVPTASIDEVVKRFEKLTAVKESYMFEDMQKAKSILNKQGLTKDDERFVKLKSMLGNKNTALLGKFVEFAILQNEDVSEIERVYQLYLQAQSRNIKMKQINLFKNLEELDDYLHDNLQGQTRKQLFNTVPPKAASLIDEKIMNLIRANENYQKSIISFISRKGSSWNSSKELYNAIMIKLKEWGQDWSLESYEKYFSKFDDKDAKILYASPESNVLVVHIKNFKASNKAYLDGKASADWCICKGQSSWDNYAVKGFASQYFVYDFNLSPDNTLSRIGTTINMAGKITEARDFKDTVIPNSVEYFRDVLGIM